MDALDAKVNFSKLEKELSRDLKDAEFQNAGDSTHDSYPPPVKLVVNVPPVMVKLIVDFKNSIEAKIISKDMDEDTKEFIRNYLKSTPKEIEIYNQVFNILATDVAPENYKEFLNRWLCNPIIACTALLIELELDKLLHLRAELKNRKPVEAA